MDFSNKEELFKDFINLEDMQQYKDRLLYLGITNQNLLTLNQNSTEVKMKGVVMSDKESMFTASQLDGRFTIEEKTLLMQLYKFIYGIGHLDLDIIQMMCIEPDCILYTHPLFDRLIDNLDIYFWGYTIYRSYRDFLDNKARRAKFLLQEMKITHGIKRKETEYNELQAEMENVLSMMIKLPYIGESLMRTGKFINRFDDNALNRIQEVEEYVMNSMIGEKLIDSIENDGLKRLKDSEKESVLDRDKLKAEELIISIVEDFYYGVDYCKAKLRSTGVDTIGFDNSLNWGK